VLGALEHLTHLRAAGLDGRQLLERGVGAAAPRSARSVVLPVPGRAVEDHRVRVALLDGLAQRGAVLEQVLLADHLADGLRRIRRRARASRAHAGRGARLLALVRREELIHGRKYEAEVPSAEIPSSDGRHRAPLQDLLRLNTVNPRGTSARAGAAWRACSSAPGFEVS
jgi:hypothetical protein